MGLLERDPITRLTKELGELLAQVHGLAAAGKPREAREALEAGSPAVLGMDFGALALVDAPSAAKLLKTPSRVQAFARLVQLRADLYGLCGETSAARRAHGHALELWLEVLGLEPGHVEAQAAVERLAAALGV